MNGFLENLLYEIEKEYDIVAELIKIDNKVQHTAFSVEKLITFLKENLNRDKLLDLNLNGKTIILTEGNPLLITSLLNDFFDKISHLYLNKSFLGINKWLYSKCINYYITSPLIIDLDIDEFYDRYFNTKKDILVIGHENFINGTQRDFDQELIKYIFD